MSGWLLFVQAARACDAGTLTHSCILDEATSVTEWTGAGCTPPPTRPRTGDLSAGSCFGSRAASSCANHPGAGKERNGFNCGDDFVVGVAGGGRTLARHRER